MLASIDFVMMGQVLISFILGCLIGLEREIHSRPAGIRTYAAVCLGACIFGLISTHPYILNSANSTVDPTRIAAQVASGVGFIGAGVIFKEGLNTVGLTTAATIWATASVGLAVAFHLYFVAIISTILTIIILSMNFLPLIRKLSGKNFQSEE